MPPHLSRPPSQAFTPAPSARAGHPIRAGQQVKTGGSSRIARRNLPPRCGAAPDRPTPRTRSNAARPGLVHCTPTPRAYSPASPGRGLPRGAHSEVAGVPSESRSIPPGSPGARRVEGLAGRAPETGRGAASLPRVPGRPVAVATRPRARMRSGATPRPGPTAPRPRPGAPPARGVGPECSRAELLPRRRLDREEPRSRPGRRCGRSAERRRCRAAGAGATPECNLTVANRPTRSTAVAPHIRSAT